MPSAYPSTRDLKRLAAAAKAALGEKIARMQVYADGRVDFFTEQSETSEREAKLAVDEWESLNRRPQNDVR